MELKSGFAPNGKQLSPNQMHAADDEDVTATARRRCYIDLRCEAASGDGAFRASDGAAATSVWIAGRLNGRGIRSERLQTIIAKR